MDSSRKRKANNATPSNTDGSATKKIKLVVRVPLLYAVFFAVRFAIADRVQANGTWVCMCVSDGSGARCWWCCEREDKSRRFASLRERAWAALDFEDPTYHTAPPSYSADPP
jgi:hypothetical protein